MKFKTGEKVYIALATIVIWFALCLQFNLSLKLFHGNVASTFKLLVSYFTVLTNFLAAIFFTTLWFSEDTKVGKFFAKPSTATAITVYMLIVGLIYNVALRGLVALDGLDRVSDELLHVINPLLVLGYWIFFVSKSKLKYKYALLWLVNPLIYVVFIVIRGYLIDKYPYPFIDVATLGYAKAILNAAIIMIVFWLVSILFVFTAKKLSKA